MALRLNEFSEGIAAFYTDLGNLMHDVIVLSMTEFGRSAEENGSRGTDHGNASTWHVIGKSIQGGIYTGARGWPGLRPEQLDRGRYLAHTVDFRDVMAEVLTQHLTSQELASVLPGHHYTPVGFL